MSETKSAGYFRSGIPFNRFGHGPRVVVFQGLVFENKPLTGFVARYNRGLYHFLEHDYTTCMVTRRPGLPDSYTETLFRETAADIPNACLILYEGMRHPASGEQFGRDVLRFLREGSDKGEA